MHNQLIFDKDVKNTHTEKTNLLKNSVGKNCPNKIEPPAIQHRKLHTKWFKLEHKKTVTDKTLAENCFFFLLPVNCDSSLT